MELKLSFKFLIYLQLILFLFDLTHFCNCQEQSGTTKSDENSTNVQVQNDSLAGIIFYLSKLLNELVNESC